MHGAEVRSQAGGGGGAGRGRGQVSPLPQVVPDGRLVQAFALVQEAGDLLGCVLQKFILHQELDPLVGGSWVSGLGTRKPRPSPHILRNQSLQSHPHPQRSRTEFYFQAFPRSLNTIRPTS